MSGNSPYNPFRDPHLTPQHTNVSSSGQGQATSPPRDTTSPGNTNSLEAFSVLDVEGIPADAPPAYTPTADPYRGEAPLEFGPTRPFQPLSPQSYPSLINSAPSRFSLADESRVALAPPPRHPSIVSRAETQSLNASNASGTFSAHSENALTGSENLGRTYQPPHGTPPGQARRYSPPPGVPPRRSASVNRPTATPTPSSSGGLPNDGRPTNTPVPGHPLLKDGKMLVYPAGYECSKCHNTGYKSYDPSNPCRKCWQKYARNYAGPLAYAPLSSEPGSSSSHSGNFQRPLPVFKPPHASLSRPHSTAGYPGHGYRMNASQPPNNHPHPNFYPQTPPFLAPPGPPMIFPPGPPIMFPPGPPPMPFPHSAPVSPVHQSPPAVPRPLVLPPGDPRIGGRLCWRCDGRGRVSFLLFDTETCEVCRGVGRVF